MILTVRQKKIKSSSKIINLNKCEGWYFDKNSNLHHKSGQFFKIKGVETKGAMGREVKSWTQPILTQKHGGVLAFISRQSKKYGTQFLIDAKIEPGDDSIIKISPSFQATQSNMNQPHGGKKPKFYDIKSFYADQKEDYKICDQSILKSWIKDKYDV